MARHAHDWIASLPSEGREQIERCKAELRAERATFLDVQKFGNAARLQAAEQLGIDPDELDRRLEAAEAFIACLQDRLEQQGGRLTLDVSLPGHETVHADRLRDLHNADDPTKAQPASDRRAG
jgi:hypothetical protein